MSEKQKIQVSEDLKYLLDESGQKIAEYNEAVNGYIDLRHRNDDRVDMSRIEPVKWECYDDCVRYDQNMNCLQSIRRCDPIFDLPKPLP